MILTGNSSAEALIPGSVSAISGALETVGSSAQPARAASHAWQCMALPEWQGQAAASWASFTPQETRRMDAAAPAFNRAAAALLRYQGAFQTARAETQAAIGEAAAAEQATAHALSAHNSAVRTAALAEPGTPEAIVAPYRDPGATQLANAQSRYATAQMTLQTAGDEAATVIYAAGNETSEEDSGISLWEQVYTFPAAVLWYGIGGQLVDTIVGTWEMLPIQALWEQWFGGKDDAWSEWLGMWGDIIGGIINDPGAALEAVFREFIAADHWDEYAGEGVGRVLFNVATLAVGGAGLVKGLKSLRGLGVKPPKIDPTPLVKPRSIDRTTPGGQLVPENFDQLGGLSPEEFIARHWDASKVNDWDGSTGGWIYPPDRGFDLSKGAPEPIDLPAGYRFDRFGGTGGDFVSPEGTGFPQRAIPPDSLDKPYHVYEVIKPFDDASGKPLAGAIAEAFEQPGGGIQFELPQNVQWLLDNGYIKEVAQ